MTSIPDSQKPARAGVDLGGTKIEAVVVDRANKVLGSARRPTPTSGGPAAVAEEIAAAVREAAHAADLDVANLSGVSVGSPGAVDIETGVVSHARNLPGREEPFPLSPTLRTALGVPVALGNDVNVATAAEFKLGAGKPYRSLLGVFWGTGVGGAMILNGKPWLGRGHAGEIGHTVVKRGGARCGCGRRGCLEAYAGRASMEARARRVAARGGRTKLFKLMKHQGGDRLTSRIWEHALDDGDKLAAELIDRAVAALGTGIASAVNLLDIEAVILGGGLGTRLGPRYLEPIENEMARHLFVSEQPPGLRIAALGDLGGALGASLFDTLLAPPARRFDLWLDGRALGRGVVGRVGVGRLERSRRRRVGDRAFPGRAHDDRDCCRFAFRKIGERTPDVGPSQAASSVVRSC